MLSSENSNWLYDFGLIDDIPIHGGDDFSIPPTEVPWTSQTLNIPTNVSHSVEVIGSFGDSVGLKESGSQKRGRSETSNASGSKACREKMRREKLNERFLELGSILNPGRPGKVDKAAILSDAARMVNQLRDESKKLKESNENLQEELKELKVEKNELREEKQRLKTEKEKLEQQVKAMAAQPTFMPHPSPIPTAFAAHGQAASNKMMPFMGYPGVAMWQYMPPASVDTSQDHFLRPPVA